MFSPPKKLLAGREEAGSCFHTMPGKRADFNKTLSRQPKPQRYGATDTW
jgi:hypothetical protein